MYASLASPPTSETRQQRQQPFHRELPHNASARLVAGHPQYDANVDVQEAELQHLSARIDAGLRDDDVTDTEVVGWVEEGNQISVHLSAANFTTAAAHVNDAVDVMNRMHITLSTRRLPHTKSSVFKDSIATIKEHLHAAQANLRTYVRSQQQLGAGPLLCTDTVLRVLRNAEERLLQPTFRRTSIPNIRQALLRMRSKYVRLLPGRVGALSPLLTRIDELVQQTHMAESTDDHAAYAHLAQNIRRLRRTILDHRANGLFTTSDMQCEDHRLDGTTSTEAFVQRDTGFVDSYDMPLVAAAPHAALVGAPHPPGRRRPPAAAAADDLTTGAPDLLDMTLRELIDSFVDAWRAIFAETRDALHAMHNSKQTDVRALLNDFAATTLQSLLHPDRLVHVGVALMLLSIFIYTLFV